MIAHKTLFTKPTTKSCPYCQLKTIYSLDEYFYCVNCEIYLKNKTNRFISNKFVPDSFKILCKDCINNKQVINCNDFKEYYKKLRLCECCRKIFKSKLKDLFFRHRDLFKHETTRIYKYFPNAKNNYRLFIIFCFLILLGFLHKSSYIYVSAFLFANFLKFNLFVFIYEFLFLFLSPEYFYISIIWEYFRLTIFKEKLFKVPFLLNNETDQMISAFNKLSIKEERERSKF